MPFSVYDDTACLLGGRSGCGRGTEDDLELVHVVEDGFVAVVAERAGYGADRPRGIARGRGEHWCAALAGLYQTAVAARVGGHILVDLVPAAAVLAELQRSVDLGDVTVAVHTEV